MELINVKGFVLKEQTYKENDKIVWILCENIGKISVLAKNAKKSTNSSFVVTQPFSLVQLNLKKGKSFHYIVDGTLIKNLDFIGCRDSIFYLTYFFELLDIAFSEKDIIDRNFFKFLLNIFLMFEVPEINKNLIMRIFELRILKEIGCNFEFEYCYYCSNRVKGSVSYFDFSLQNVVCVSCRKLKEFKVENRTINIMRFLGTVNVSSILKIKISDEDMDFIFKINKVFLEQNLVKMPNSIKFLGGY